MARSPKTRRIFRSVVAVAIAVLAALGAWIALALLTRPEYIPPDTSDWRTGDIFFSVGDSWESVAVRSLTIARGLCVADSTPSHCGIVVRSAGGIHLVHASTSAKRIVSETPEEYLRNNGSCCIYRRSLPCSVDTTILKAHIDSLMTMRVAFDFSFDHHDSRELYCTELVVRLLKMNGIEDFSDLRSHSHIYPQDLAKRCISK